MPRPADSRRAASRRPSSPPKRPTPGGRPLIGVTGHHQRDAGGRELIVANEPYLAAVYAAGGLPVVLAPVSAPEDVGALLQRVDGLLFTGGQDIDPHHFGEAVLNETVRPEPERDAFELPLMRAAVAENVPLLAVCRGCQVLNVAFGGTLWQDLPAQLPDGLVHRQTARRDAVTHAVRVIPGSLLAGVIGEAAAGSLHTNTFHHQAARDVPDGLTATAYSGDGTIEALEIPGRTFVLGVQWHPEHLAPSRPAHHRLFVALVTAARSATSPLKATA